MRNLKNRLVDFHKIFIAGTSKLVDVQCKFMFKSEHKILSYGRFKILVYKQTPFIFYELFIEYI